MRKAELAVDKKQDDLARAALHASKLRDMATALPSRSPPESPGGKSSRPSGNSTRNWPRRRPRQLADYQIGARGRQQSQRCPHPIATSKAAFDRMKHKVARKRSARPSRRSPPTMLMRLAASKGDRIEQLLTELKPNRA
jgi:hypothetical protein